MYVWLGETIRPTRDADLLGFGDLSDEALAGIFRDVCSVEVEPDAMLYLKDSIRVSAIRPQDAYGGERVTCHAQLGAARLRVQVDVGLGDAVSPPPEWLDYPSLLDLPRPRLRAYRPETAIAEKVHAMVLLGARNSRMRDFYDVYMLAMLRPLDGRSMAEALRATFQRRDTAIPEALPVALTSEFADMQDKRVQWRAFLSKNGLASAPEELGMVIGRLVVFLEPVIHAAHAGEPMAETWIPGGPWRRVESEAGGQADA